VIGKSDSSGDSTYQATYEAFGTRTSEIGSTQDRQKANTKDEEPELGLLNEGFRYRDLETGSFITRDPLGFVDGPNMYSYVVGNPWTKFDPEGLEAKDILPGLGDFAKGIGTSIANIPVGFVASAGVVADTIVNPTPLVDSVKAIAANPNAVPEAAGSMVKGAVQAIDAKLSTNEGIGEVVGTLATMAVAPRLGPADDAAAVNAETKGASLARPTQSASETVGVSAPEVQAQLKATSLSKGDTYGNLTDPAGVAPGKKFTPSQLAQAKEANAARNGGVMRDDVTGKVMTPSQKATAGSKVDPRSVQGDHVTPRNPKDPNATRGSNSFKNLKLRQAQDNRKKSNN
jgi:RHS repeat-associated protein